MKPKKRFKNIAAIILTAIFLATSVAVPEYPQVYAATTKINTWGDNQVICGKKAALELPGSWKKCRIKSSDKRVATVSKKGKVTAKRLGVTTITAIYKKKKSKYSITVVPEDQNDVKVTPGILFYGQKVKLSLKSDKYDTSCVKLSINNSEFNSEDDGISYENKGGWTNSSISTTCRYGSYYIDYDLEVFDSDNFVDMLLYGSSSYYNDNTSNLITGIDAGKEQKISFSEYDKTFTPTLLQTEGISVDMDGAPLSDTVVYTPGSHEITVKADGSEIVKKDFTVSYSVEDTLTKMDATGWPEDCKSVFDAAFDADKQIVTDGMSDREKIRAIHDYLVYNANYVNNGDYSSAENWAYGATGVLLHKEGVCQSYALAFYIMARAAGLECRYVTGTASNSLGTGGHAWNRVKVDGQWYYVDCTWDDPVGGGYENYNYYMSESLWSDHTAKTESDLAIDTMNSKDFGAKYDWLHFYLTGEDYKR